MILINDQTIARVFSFCFLIIRILFHVHVQFVCTYKRVSAVNFDANGGWVEFSLDILLTMWCYMNNHVAGVPCFSFFAFSRRKYKVRIFRQSGGMVHYFVLRSHFLSARVLRKRQAGDASLDVFGSRFIQTSLCVPQHLTSHPMICTC